MKHDVYVLRAEFGRYTDTFKNEGYVGIGWYHDNPYGWDLTNRDFLKLKYRELYPDDPYMRMNQNVGQVYRFVNELRVGDLVISPFMDN
jgi:restriction system protein